VKAKQEAMFQDKRLLKVDPEISSSFMLTPNSDNEQQAEKNEENVQPAKVDTLKPLDVSDDEWARVRAAQEKLFDSTADDRNNDENTESVSSGTRKVSEVLTSLVEESRHKQPSAARFSSAEKVKAALAKKEEQSDVKEEPIKLEATKETTESDDPIDVDLDAHEFFVDIENHEFFADLGDKGEGTTSPTTDTSERDMSTPDIVVSESVEDKKPPSPLKTKVTQTDTETPQPSLKDLVRQRSLVSNTLVLLPCRLCICLIYLCCRSLEVIENTKDTRLLHLYFWYMQFYISIFALLIKHLLWNFYDM
jgi:hypothetical protein